MQSTNWYTLKVCLKYPPNVILLSLSILFNAVVWFWLFINIRPQGEYIYLHYNILFGVDLLDAWYKVVYLPIIGLVIIVANFLIGLIFFNKDKFVSQIFNTVSLICQIFLVIFSALLVFLNA